MSFRRLIHRLPPFRPLPLVAGYTSTNGSIWTRFRSARSVPPMENNDLVNLLTPSAIVIGGGFAGLAAAHALKAASFTVVVLESRDRIGGRAHTDYSLGFPIDLGASWLHGVCDDNPLVPLIQKLDLPLHLTSGPDSILTDNDSEICAVFDSKGQKVPSNLMAKMGDVFEAILAETTKLRDELTEDVSIAEAISIVLERHPYLRQEGLAHDVLQWYMHRIEGWFAADADSISLQGWDKEVLLPGGHGIMVKGYFPVVHFLAEDLDVRLCHRVNKIVRHKDRVEVKVNSGRTFLADATVITVPTGVLKANSIVFEPRLPEWKERAIHDMPIGYFTKIVLQFDTVFWPNVNFLGVASSPSSRCTGFLNLHKVTGHPVLVYMCVGRQALDIEHLSDGAAAKFALSELKRILPDAPESIGYLITRWGTDENSLGAYTYDGVGKPLDLYEKLRMPVDNLFFAGESTSIKFPGTVHGAFSSGLAAADECRTRVLEGK